MGLKTVNSKETLELKETLQKILNKEIKQDEKNKQTRFKVFQNVATVNTVILPKLSY
jgi:hypothetical protein